MTWQWWRRDFNAQEYRRTVRRAIPADHKNTRVYLDLRVGGWLMMCESSCGNSQTLRNFPHTSPGVGGLATPFVFGCLITRLIDVYLGPSVQPIPPVFSHPPTLWSVLEPSAICPFVSITARLIAGNEPLDG